MFCIRLEQFNLKNSNHLLDSHQIDELGLNGDGPLQDNLPEEGTDIVKTFWKMLARSPL